MTHFRKEATFNLGKHSEQPYGRTTSNHNISPCHYMTWRANILEFSSCNFFLKVNNIIVLTANGLIGHL